MNESDAGTPSITAVGGTVVQWVFSHSPEGIFGSREDVASGKDNVACRDENNGKELAELQFRALYFFVSAMSFCTTMGKTLARGTRSVYTSAKHGVAR